MNENRFSFKKMLSRWLNKSEDGSISHPSEMVDWNNVSLGRNVNGVVAVYTAVRIISESVGSVPLEVFRRTGTGKERDMKHPLWHLLRVQPCRGMTPMTWRETLQRHLSLRGNCFCLKVFSRRRIIELIPIHPDRVTVLISLDGVKTFRIHNRNGTYVEKGTDEIWHMFAMSDDGFIGMSPIDVLADTFSIAYEAQLYAAKSMKQDGATGITLSHPGRLKTETRDELKKSWTEQNAGGRNAGKPLLLEEGLTASRLNLTMEQMQFIETRKMQRSEIAAVFRVPPHMIGDLERATFSNIEHQGIEFVSYTVRPWAVRWEEALLTDIISWYNEPDLFAEFDLDDLSRGDKAGRYAAYSSAINAGWMVRNEARVEENMNKLEGLDEPLEPRNMQNPGGSENPDQKKPGQDDVKPPAQKPVKKPRDRSED